MSKLEVICYHTIFSLALAPTDRMSSTAKGFIQAPYESARDRFLQENDDSSLDNFIADDDSESASSSAESEGANDNTQAVDNSVCASFTVHCILIMR